MSGILRGMLRYHANGATIGFDAHVELTRQVVQRLLACSAPLYPNIVGNIALETMFKSGHISQGTITEFNARHSTIIRVLPLDVVGRCFGYLSFSSLRAAISVCSHWRSIGLQDSSLWTALNLWIKDPEQVSTMLPLFLQRSRSRPVDLSLMMWSVESYRHISSVLPKFAHRIRTLSVTCGRSAFDDIDELRTLSLDFRLLEDISVTGSLHLQSAPHLHTMRVGGVKITDPLLEYPRLHTFIGRVDPDCVSAVLSSCRNLRKLDLRLDSDPFYGTQVYRYDYAVPPRLESLALSSEGPPDFDFDRFLAMFHGCYALRDVTIKAAPNLECIDNLFAALGQEVYTIYMSSEYDLAKFETRNPTGLCVTADSVLEFAFPQRLVRQARELVLGRLSTHTKLKGVFHNIDLLVVRGCEFHSEPDDACIDIRLPALRTLVVDATRMDTPPGREPEIEPFETLVRRSSSGWEVFEHFDEIQNINMTFKHLPAFLSTLSLVHVHTLEIRGTVQGQPDLPLLRGYVECLVMGDQKYDITATA